MYNPDAEEFSDTSPDVAQTDRSLQQSSHFPAVEQTVQGSGPQQDLQHSQMGSTLRGRKPSQYIFSILCKPLLLNANLASTVRTWNAFRFSL